MAIPLKISTGVEACPDRLYRCFVVGSLAFLFSCSDSHIVLMISCLLPVADTATLWGGCGLEGVSLWRLPSISIMATELNILYVKSLLCSGQVNTARINVHTR